MICLITIFLWCAVFFINIQNASAESSFDINDYTNSDKLINSDRVINEYLGDLYEPYNLTYSELPDLYGSTIKNSINGIMVSGDDPIVEKLRSTFTK